MLLGAFETMYVCISECDYLSCTFKASRSSMYKCVTGRVHCKWCVNHFLKETAPLLDIENPLIWKPIRRFLITVLDLLLV